jgi:hypothetical protein
LSPRIKQESAKSTFAGPKFDVYGLKYRVERATLQGGESNTALFLPLVVRYRGNVLAQAVSR